MCEYLKELGYAITYLPVDEHGMVSVDDVKKAITPQTILITVMHANNEVGTIQPIGEIARLAHNRGIVMHTDAAQSVGKIAADVDVLGVDLLSVAGHKLYAPKGIGVLYIRQGTLLAKFMHGAGHEQGRRAGTENVLEIVGLGKACDIAQRDLKKNGLNMKKMQERLHSGLCDRVNTVKHNGHLSQCLPNTLSLSFHGTDATTIISKISEQVAVSAGSACHSGECKISHVLQAMKVPLEWAKGTIRFSTGKMTTEDEIDRAVQVISAAYQSVVKEKSYEL